MRSKIDILAYGFEDGLNDEWPDLASVGIFAYKCEDVIFAGELEVKHPRLINELPDLDATAEPDDLPDLAVQPGVVDFAGLDYTAGHANISDDNGVLYVVDEDVVEDTSALTHSLGSL